MVKEILETLMREEREIYLEEHLTKANGYYTRDLLTLIGPLEDLRVPRVREGDFHPKILPYRRPTSLELSEAVLALYAAGVSTRNVVDPKDWTSFGPPLESRAASASCSYHLASNSAGVK